MPAKTMDRFIVELDAALSERTGGDMTSEAGLRRRLSTVVKACGWKQRSYHRMEQLQKSLETNTIYPSVRLTDLSLPLSTAIRFRREAPLPPLMEFDNEKDLERFLANNHRLLLAQVQDFEGSRHVAGGTRAQRRYAYGRSYVKPDLVFKTSDGTIVVAEVKLGDPDDRGVTQLRKYLSAASKRHGRVRGLLITGRPRSRAHGLAIAAEVAAVTSHRIDWIQYSTHMTLTTNS